MSYTICDRDAATVFPSFAEARKKGGEILLPAHQMTAVIAPVPGGCVLSLPMRSDVALLPTRYVAVDG